MEELGYTGMFGKGIFSRLQKNTSSARDWESFVEQLA